MDGEHQIRNQIGDMLFTLIEADIELINLFNAGKMTDFLTLGEDVLNMSRSIMCVAKEREEIDSLYETLWKMAGNIEYSVSRVLIAAGCGDGEKRDFVAKKMEFELLPLCRAAYAFFRYHAQVKSSPRDIEKWMEEEGKELCKNYYLEQGKQTGEFKYDLSIRVLAYNNLEYTKMCVESIKRCLPQNATYELILINHGSSDGTKEFFETIKPDKQIDVLYNGGMGIAEAYIYEGKYPVFISNDVILTPPVLDLMFDAMENDPTIGCLLPMTANISNLQVPASNGIELKYDSIEELFEKVERFSVVDRCKEEVRFRLCTPLFTTSPEVYDDVYVNLLIFSNQLMFPDDLISLVCRRGGYKNVLMKNAYCHHFPSVTIRKEGLDQKKYDNGRKAFLEAYGIDPWGRGFCWTYELFHNVRFDKPDASRILGINCGLGSDPLKIQQELKETTGNTNVAITNVTNCNRYIPDLRCLSDEVYEYKERNEIFNQIKGDFDYIIVEDDLENGGKFILRLYDMLNEGGYLILFLAHWNSVLASSLKKQFENDIVVIDNVTFLPEIDETVSVDRMPMGEFLVIRK